MIEIEVEIATSKITTAFLNFGQTWALAILWCTQPLCRSVGQSVCRWLAVGCDHSFNFRYTKSKRDRLTRIFRSYLRTRLAVGELRFGGVAVWGSCGVRELWSPTQAYFLTAQSTHSYFTRLKKSKNAFAFDFFLIVCFLKYMMLISQKTSLY